MSPMEGIRVLVTGGSRGIGAAACELFARAGASVGVHFHHDSSAADMVVSRLGGGAGHFTIGADLGNRREVETVFEAVESAWGRLDCLVNNAGVWRYDPIDEFDDASLDATLDLNVRGVFYCVRAAIPLLRQSDRASIVNLTSTAGQRGEPLHSPYAASKGAIIAATKSWATELAPGIRVNAVAPGWVDTDMSREALESSDRDHIFSEIPLRRVASAEDIAGPIVFLASSAARQITGEILNVNGGSVLAG